MADSDVGTKRSASQADPISPDDSSDTKRPKTDAEGTTAAPQNECSFDWFAAWRGFCRQPQRGSFT